MHGNKPRATSLEFCDVVTRRYFVLLQPKHGCQMTQPAIRNIRPLAIDDIPLITTYFHQLGEKGLLGMGVQPSKLPEVEEWNKLIAEDLTQPVELRQFYYLIWELDGISVGHANINKIVYGDHAFMHLHLWRPTDRRAGHGTKFVRETLPMFATKFRLTQLFSEPFAGNPAPNKTLPKAGFKLVRTYETIPGWINYHQTVNRWQWDA